MANDIKRLIEQRADLIRQEFIDSCTRKVRSGGFDVDGAEDNHGMNGLGPVYTSALNEMHQNQKGTLSKKALKEAKNLDCF